MKLLANQLHEFEDEPVEGFLVRADESNIFKWDVWIEGPSDTPYAGGVFKLRLEFPPDFPLNPPTLHFISDFWHPNGLRFITFFSTPLSSTPDPCHPRQCTRTGRCASAFCTRLVPTR